MFGPYRALLARGQARLLALACAFGWLAFGGYNLALILLVHATRGSFALAGAVVAAFAVGSGVGAPFRGRLVDRHGGRLLMLFAAGHAGAAATLLVGCAQGVPAAIVLAAAAVSGLSVPPVMATARAEWSRTAGELAPTAHALTGALADLGQLTGPALVGLLATLSADLAFALEAAMASLAATIVAVLRRPQDTPDDDGQPTGLVRQRRSLLSYPGLRTLVIGDLGLGLTFGAVEVAIPALCAEHGSASLAAVPLSVSAGGSVLISILSGTGRLHRSAAWRYVVGVWGTALSLIVLIPVGSIAGVSCVLILSGAAGGLLNVGLFELLDRVVPGDRAIEAFTWLTSGQAAGMAAGALVAGQLTGRSITAAFVLAAGAALASALAVTAARNTLHGTVRRNGQVCQ
jgi:MFS family permease